MRIPLPVAVLIALLAVSGFWWLRTKDMDFLTPSGTINPLPEFMTRSVALGPDSEPDAVLSPEARELIDTDPPPPKPDQPPLEFGDLESAPGLAEYSEHASKWAGYLVRLATELELQGQWVRSLLAWERVIDSCHPSDAERKSAEDAILRIRPTLTHWNIDPEGDLPILIQLGTSRRSTDSLKEATQKVAEFIRGTSDDMLLVTPRITTSSSSDSPANAPIAIYFSRTGQAAKNQTGLQSVSPEGDDVDTYLKELLAASYRIVRQTVGNAGTIVQPRPSSNPDRPELDFQRQVTRLHWKVFAEFLARQPSGESEN